MENPYAKYVSQPTQSSEGNPYAKYKVAEKPKGFVDRMSEDFAKRKEQMQLAANRSAAGEQSDIQDALQGGGLLVGGAYDVVGNILGSAGRIAYDQAPETLNSIGGAIKSGAQNVGSAIYNQAPETLNAAGNLAKRGITNYQAWAEANPAEAATLGGAANIASVLPVGKAAQLAQNAATVAAPIVGKAAVKVAQGAGKVAQGAGKVAKATAKAALPKIDEGLQETAKLAFKYKIPLSLDQVSRSKALKSAQKVSQEVPFSGQEKFRARQVEAWNKAVTKTLGQESKSITPEYIDGRFTELGSRFNDLGKGEVYNPQTLLSKVDNLAQEGIDAGASKEAIEGFKGFVEREVGGSLENGLIKGEALNRIRARANELARASNNFDSKSLYHNFESEVIDNLLPDKAAKEGFKELKQQYKNLLAVEPLLKNEVGGVVSPSQLANRMATVYQRQYYRGKAGELGELARVGKQLLPELGGSDTAQKVAGIAAITGMATNPATIPLVGSGVIANRLGQTLVNRNQALIGALLKGDKTAMKELGKLPPREAQSIMQMMKSKLPKIKIEKVEQ